MIPNEEPSVKPLFCDQHLPDEVMEVAEPDYPGQYPYTSLEEFLSLHEGRYLDFKETVSESFFKLLSAFSNTEGGFVILGVNDKTRRVTGFGCRGERLSELANRISDGLGIHPVIDEIPADGRTILIITVSPQKKPISYRGVITPGSAIPSGRSILTNSGESFWKTPTGRISWAVVPSTILTMRQYGTSWILSGAVL
ncbi:helix-turn-helix domain-containing protein [Methanoculleus sp. UBA303]|jgi:ATP-dependent DNA helicase RecG|uniref:AlbA family DNA-binding domain-containing protein n=1 Tax=Methanoculleus sp. UBA303 TaxID=1915497 RepID=UPI0025F085B7|nr:ATP-binding protein [Methanoculleus sp. UBA303]